MSLDAFSVVVAFLALVEVALGVVAVVAGLRESRSPTSDASETRRPLLALVGATLLVVAVLSYPLFLLLLESWVPRWGRDVMCMEGVRRIGMGTVGPSRVLPTLVAVLDVTKPALVFAAGAWAVMRRAGGASALRRAAFAATALGLLAVVDGGVAGAYVAIPKEEVAPSAGCCTTSSPDASRADGLVAGGVAYEDGTAFTVGFLGLATLLGVGATVLARPRPTVRAATAVFAVAAAASLAVAVPFLVDVLSPAVQRLPHHHCAWCAFQKAPEVAIGAALYFGAVCCAGWAAISRLVRPPQDAGPASRLLWSAAFGFLGTAIMAGVVLWGA